MSKRPGTITKKRKAGKAATAPPSKSLNRGLGAANSNKLSLKKLITTSYDGCPIAGQMTLFPEYTEANGKCQKPKAMAVILDHVKDEDGDGAANIDDVKLFLKRNKAARIALNGCDKYPGGDFRSPECVKLLKQADIVVTNPPFSTWRLGK